MVNESSRSKTLHRGRKTAEGGKLQMGGKLRLLKPWWCSVGSCSGGGRFLFLHLARTHPSSFFSGLKCALKQVKQRSLRQGSASSGDTAEKTARNTSFWFSFLCSYGLPCEYLHHRPTAHCCSPPLLHFPLNLCGSYWRRLYCTASSFVIVLWERIVIAQSLPFWSQLLYVLVVQWKGYLKST